MKKESLSVITIAYDNLYISETISSVNNLREYLNIEHIVINGGNKLNHKIVCNVEKLVEEQDEGIYDALNKGLSLVSNEYLMFIHADDFVNDALGISQTLNMLKSTNSDYALGRAVVNTSPNRYHGSFFWRPWLLKFHVQPPHLASIYKREILPLFNTDLKIISDYLMFQSIKDFNFIKTRKILVRHTPGGESNSYINNTKEFEKVSGKKAWLILPFRLLFKVIFTWY